MAQSNLYRRNLTVIKSYKILRLFSSQSTEVVKPKSLNISILSENINIISKLEVQDIPSDEQLKLLDLFKSGQNVYFTGKAGTGKTVALKHFINHLKEEKIPYAVTAPTGVAAASLNGQTLHSFSSLPINIHNTNIRALCAKIKSQKTILKRYRETKVLIIDEISMLNSDFFDSLNECFKIIRENTNPFGGVQLILSGDFFQLPPIQKAEIKTSKKEQIRVKSDFLKLYYENYDPDIHQGYSDEIIDDRRYLFDSKSWYELIMCGMQVRQLTQGFRQKDLLFSSILDDIRLGVHSPELFKFLIPSYRKKFNDSQIKPTYLSAYRRKAEMYNDIELKKLPGFGHTFDSIEYVTNENFYWPNINPKELKNVFYNIQSHQHLHLKIGAQVILLRNINPKDGLANGSRGVITGFSKSKDEITKMELYLPLVRFVNGKTFMIGYHEFKSELDEQLTVVRYQIPLKLGWGITIHKAQGMTLDRAMIQLDQSLAPGHAYVALSRVKDLEGLSLKQFSKKSIWVSERVKQFYNDIVNRSRF